MSNNESRADDADPGGPAEGEPVTPEDSGAEPTAEDDEHTDVQEIPLGTPVTETEMRRLKEDARRPSDGDTAPQADTDRDDEET
jgi:hypothetical protein